MRHGSPGSGFVAQTVANACPALLIFMIGFLSLTACGQSAASYNNQGNKDFEAKRYDQALDNYTSSQLEDPDLAEPYYNAGNAYHRKGDLDSAVPQLQQSLRTAEDELAEQSFYNLGNTYFKAEDWPAAITAYEQALRLNPNDMDAKHNLELALQQLQQQQQQQQQGGQQGQQQQDQNGQQGQQQQPQQQGNQQDQGQGDLDNQNDSEGGQADQQEQDPPRGLSPEEAEQLLDALGQNNQTLQERLQEEFQAPGPPPAQDW